MKTIGLLGGMSWESTVTYYQEINRQVKFRLGGLHSAKVILFSVDFQEIEGLMRSGKWLDIGMHLADAAVALETAGAEVLLLCTNTIHKIAPQIESAIKIPFLHIADATAAEVKRAGISKIGLLGTRFTMEEDFYMTRLHDLHGLSVLVPDAKDRTLVDRVIFEELCLGRINASSREEYQRIVASLVDRGAEGVILGCTEIAFLLDPGDAPVPFFDTTAIHARQAVDWALENHPGTS